MGTTNKIDDLSYSNLVSIIQGEDKIGADLINDFANELIEVRSEIATKKHELQCLESRERSLFDAALKVRKHLKKELPLIVQRQGYVVVFSSEELTIERNVI